MADSDVRERNTSLNCDCEGPDDAGQDGGSELLALEALFGLLLIL
ncbi:MAG: hypothetical protein ACREE6_04000 [Limisphaerales bacterium]